MIILMNNMNIIVIENNGNFEFEGVELSKEKIPMCIGCFNCIKKCPHNSYIETIVKKIEAAMLLLF